MRHLALLTLLLGLSGLAGCKWPVFKEPVTVSTRSSVSRYAEPIGRVTVERCNLFIIFIPIIRDPAEAYQELLMEAEQRGGNTIIDFQVRDSGFFAVPLFGRGCWEATGIAATL